MIGRVQGNVKMQLIAHDKDVRHVIIISYTPGEYDILVIRRDQGIAEIEY